MKRSVLILVFCTVFGTSVNADWIEGPWYWSTKFGKDFLTFRSDNQLVYQSDYKIDDRKKSYRLFGVWKFEPGVCLPDEINGTTDSSIPQGNLVLSIDSTQCCLNAEPSGDKLVLTRVWVQGSGLALHAYCSDNLLEKFQPSDN